MSSNQPPSGPQQPEGAAEYLDQGSGAPLEPPRRRSGRSAVLVGGGIVLALALVGGAVWAAMSFLRQGPQPAEALPASTLGYAAVDLDPAGGQKVEAVQMLRKFPAFREEVGIDTDDDLRERLFDEAGLAEACDGLDYAEDVEPWLGDRFAMAAVDLGEEHPDVVAVLQVSDAGAAEDGLSTLRDCAGDADSLGWSVAGEWAVVAETAAIAEDVAAATEEGSLADDADYQRWTDEAGDAGVATLYAAPEAGRYLADTFGGLAGLGLGATADPMTEQLEGFGGAAATLRFDDGALELEVASDPTALGADGMWSEAGDDVVATLPADTALAVGVGLPEGWFDAVTQQLADASGTDAETLVAQAEGATGLELPEDAEALTGGSVAVAVSPEVDGEALAYSDSPEGLPIGLRVQGDADAVEDVLAKVRPRLGPWGDAVLSEPGDGLVAISPDEDYLDALAAEGDLGDGERFTDVVREAERASSLVYVDFDAGDWLVSMAGDDQEAAENLEPLEGLGLSAWLDGDVGHAVLRVTTD